MMESVTKSATEKKKRNIYISHVVRGTKLIKQVNKIKTKWFRMEKKGNDHKRKNNFVIRPPLVLVHLLRKIALTIR